MVSPMRALLRAVVLVIGTAIFSCANARAIGDAGAPVGVSCVAGDDAGAGAYCACPSFDDQNPNPCTTDRPVYACGVCVPAARTEIARATGLHDFSAPAGASTAPDLDCLANPPAVEASKNVKLTGFVKLWSTGNDSRGVKVEIFREGANGSLGDPVGDPFVTTGDDRVDPPRLPLPSWSSACAAGCSFRSFAVQSATGAPIVPTETPLIIKTSDATGTGNAWADVYEYAVSIPNAAVDATGTASYDLTAIAAPDPNTLGARAGDAPLKSSMGILTGEVHDCGDVRLAGALVQADQPIERLVYFGENEAYPLPDPSREASRAGTSRLGAFAALDMQAGLPTKLSAVGQRDGKSVLLGTYTVQLYPAAVTILSLRGRRAWQR
jgi:hypothetical protein